MPFTPSEIAELKDTYVDYRLAKEANAGRTRTG